MATQRKYLTIGNVVNFGKFDQIQLDPSTLKDFLDFLKAFGKNKIGDLNTDEIRKAMRLNRDDPNFIPRVTIYSFDPDDKAPAFVVKSLAVKLADAEG